MHHCLAVDEIFQSIVESCVLDQFHNLDKSSVFALACTCRTFVETALDSLWHKQTSLRPLLKCLPQDTWQETSDSYDTTDRLDGPIQRNEVHLTLEREPLPEEWTRFESYARRIRVFHYRSINGYFHLGCGNEPDVIIDEHIDKCMLQALVRRFQNSPALPNLRQLRWQQSHHDPDCYLRLFLAPQLTILSLYPRGKIPSQAAVRSIKTACPSLRNFQVFPKRLSHRTYTSLIGNLPVLESLHYPLPLTPTTIVHLSCLSTLRQLDLFDHPHVITRSLAKTSTPAFAHLAELRIKAWDGPSTAELLRVLCLTRLKTLHITFYDPPDFYFHSKRLTEHHRSMFRGYRPSWPDNSDLAQVFTAVASCTNSNLRFLTISLSLSIAISPDVPFFSVGSLTSLEEFCSSVGQRNSRREVTLTDLAAVLAGESESERLFTITYVPADPKWQHVSGHSLYIDLKENSITRIRTL